MSFPKIPKNGKLNVKISGLSLRLLVSKTLGFWRKLFSYATLHSTSSHFGLGPFLVFEENCIHVKTYKNLQIT